MADIKRKVILLIQDGWGVAPPGPGNYIEQADKPVFDSLIKKYPHTQNKASGNAVGLPEGSQGNSEVGHLHMGAGRIVWQMYEVINRTIKDKSFFENQALGNAMEYAKKHNSALHLLGMCSDEGVHSHTDHLFALLKMAKKKGLSDVYIHFIADGRDVPEKSAKKYIEQIEKRIKKLGVGRIASVCGRYYAMDRDNNWDRTKKAYDLYTKGEGFKAADASEAITQAYKRGDKTDYYIQPTVITCGDGKPVALMQDDDSVIFWNFRTDRPRQLTEAFISKGFDRFDTSQEPDLLFTIMTRYDETFSCPVAFEEPEVHNNLGQVLARQALKQLRLAETEKYGHVTYFFNSQVEEPSKGEDRIMIPSPKVPSYDQKPEMSAYSIADKAVEKISSREYDFILMNFANCDLVGHSAVKKAIIRCVEVVDECTGKVVDAALENGYTVIITADHGSAEEKLYPDGEPKPAHSCNPVNFILVSEDPELQKNRIKLSKGGQKDVAPTILELTGLDKPEEMTGKSLIKD
ncbi:2,3-bisphosphoglycerate-independent phosphoglycerate mutase [Candidatus Woesearchaeota archaeon]|nr:2,3-bisphosphoglycerate-independent phosphoglycerate mutase [Candidatus Woesearchaeota archaeon]